MQRQHGIICHKLMVLAHVAFQKKTKRIEPENHGNHLSEKHIQRMQLKGMLLLVLNDLLARIG